MGAFWSARRDGDRFVYVLEEFDGFIDGVEHPQPYIRDDYLGYCRGHKALERTRRSYDENPAKMRVVYAVQRFFELSQVGREIDNVGDV